MTYLKLYNNNPTLETLAQFADFYKIQFTEKYKIENFFELNRNDIFSQFSVEQKQEIAKKLSKPISKLTAADINVNTKLPCPCYLYIQEKYISYSLISKHTNFQVPTTSTIAFEDAQIKSIFQDKGTSVADSNRISPGCRVIGWFKTMYFSNENIKKNTDLDDIYNLKQSFLDLSKYVVSLNTSVGGSGGNFTISFPHIPLYSMLLNNLNELDYSQESHKIGNVLSINSQSQNQIIPGNIKSSVNIFDYFNWLIQSNDLLFISFDDMKGLIDENLSGHKFDMIGLVDSVSLSKNPQGGLTVDVSGRDLMKVITDDSSIFYYQGVSAGNSDILKSFDNTETVLKGGDSNSLIFEGGKQNLHGNGIRQLNGNINIFACEPNDFSIDFIIKTVMSHLANMSIVPDDLFVSWANKRTTISALKPKNI